MWKWQDYAKKTNMEIDFDEYPITDFAETLKLKLTTGDMPDAYYQMIFSTDQLFEHSQNGNLIALDDLIAQYAPNIRKAFADAAVKKAVTMPDGSIYSLPWISKDKMSASVRTYVNETICKDLGLSVPQTIDELTAFMVAMKEKYPESYPLTVPGGNMGVFMDALCGAWGLGNSGIQGMASNIDLGSDGKVRFYKTSNEYKAFLKQLNAWYEQKLIHPESLTTLEVAKWQDLGKKNLVGVFAWVSPGYIGNEEVYSNFKGVSQFKGVVDKPVMGWIDADVRGIWSFMITKKNKYPVETMKWVDWWYSEAAPLYMSAGIEGETFAKNTDGKYEFIGDAKTLNDKGKLHQMMGHYGGFEPGIYDTTYTGELKKIMDDLFNPKGLKPEAAYRVDDMNDYKAYAPKDIWPGWIPTEEEGTELGEISTDMTTYMNESITKFITGAMDIDKDWDTYVQTMKDMGSDRYVEIKQAQYDRYLAD